VRSFGAAEAGAQGVGLDVEPADEPGHDATFGGSTDDWYADA
jgi:hypothetical protein